MQTKMKTVYGDILDQDYGIIVHGCNTQAIMGAGIARDIKLKYPCVFEEYYSMCRAAYNANQLLGEIQSVIIKPNLYIINAFTQKYYGHYHTWGDENYKAIESCFTKINEFALRTNLPVSFPMIGAGLGGGDFSIIGRIIDKVLDPSISRTLFLLPSMMKSKNCDFC